MSLRLSMQEIESFVNLVSGESEFLVLKLAKIYLPYLLLAF